jgi:hypothetical protein
MIMMNAIEVSQQKKREIFDKIAVSNDFSQLQKYQDLLSYLIESSDRSDLKESTIAIEFFRKDATFDPAVDSSVRAFISNLRKKLEHYYLTDGKDDDIRVTIPKGHYYVEFIKNDQRQTRISSKIHSKLPYLIFIPLTLILLSIIVYYHQTRDQQFDEKQNLFVLEKNSGYIWQEWLESDKEVLIVLGNYYFFEMPFGNGRYHFIRDQFINSEDDFDAFKNEYPYYADIYRTTSNTYLDEHIPYCLSHIIQSFVLSGKEFKLKLSSEVSEEDIRSSNIIYIGPYKCFNILNNIVEKLNFRYVGSTVSLKFYEEDTADSLIFPFRNTGEPIRKDLAMVAKVAGVYNNEFILFTSYYDFGNIATVKHFANPVSPGELKQLKSHFFEALFEIEGINTARMDLNIKLLHFNPLDPDFKVGIDQ